jgi:uncharacterized protein (TIGR03086 family)
MGTHPQYRDRRDPDPCQCVMVDEMTSRHLLACEGFSAIVHQADGAWDNPSPCTEWDARGVLEHVIGFHDVLLLRPTGTKPKRPRDDPTARWDVTAAAVRAAVDGSRAEPSADDSSQPDLARLLPMLTTEVLLHTWDLARALGVDPRLDSGLCEVSYQMALSNDQKLRSSGLFGPAIPVPDDTDPATRLVAFLGRDPEWTHGS